MNKIFCSVLILFSSLAILYPQTPKDQSDTLKNAQTDTAGTTNLLTLEILESRIDSLVEIQNARNARIASLEEKAAGYDSKMMIAYIIGGLGILLSLIALGYSSSKLRALKERIIVLTNRRDIDDLERKYLENKKRINESIEDLSGRYNTFYTEFCKVKDVLVNEVTALSLKVDVSSSLSKNIESTARKQENAAGKQAEKDPFGKPKTFLVEYFVDNGEIKFKETNSGTPFYMDLFDDRSELTVNEASYAPSNYSESIQKCFRVNGEMSGKYRNKKPALCSYDGNLNTWNLIQTGELDAL